MFQSRTIVTVASIAALASVSALLLVTLGGDYIEYFRVHSVVDQQPNYWQLAANGVAAVASVMILVALVFVRRTSESTSDPRQTPRGSGVQRRIDPPPRQVDGSSSSDKLDNKPWLSVVKECVDVFGELDQRKARFDPASRALAIHIMHRLEEALERSGVEIISDDAEVAFDRSRHKPEMTNSISAEGSTVVATLSPGFAVGPRVLRPSTVRLDSEERR